MIYLDSAATSFYRPPEVAEAVVRAMEAEGFMELPCGLPEPFTAPAACWRSCFTGTARNRQPLRPILRKV